MSKYVIFGLGTIGSNLLMQLASMDPEGEFIGIDFDKVEDRNIPTQAYFMPHIGLPKAQAMQIVLGMKCRKVKYTPCIMELKSKKDPFLSDVIGDLKNNNDTIGFDCFDNSASRKLLEGIPRILHVGFSPQYAAEVVWGDDYVAPADLKPEDNDICDMSDAVPFINLVVSVAAMACKTWVASKVKNNYLITNKMQIRKM